jgi:hypothetical protein
LNNSGTLNKFGEFYLIWRDKAAASKEEEDSNNNNNSNDVLDPNINYVGNLNELCQRNGWKVVYEDSGAEVSWTSVCKLNNQEKGEKYFCRKLRCRQGHW